MISIMEYNNFKRQYYLGRYEGQRFGQAFLNQFFPDKKDPELFYSTDDRESERMIFERYMNKTNDIYIYK